MQLRKVIFLIKEAEEADKALTLYWYQRSCRCSKIVPVLEQDYKALTTDPTQRVFRAHIINAENAIAPVSASGELTAKKRENLLCQMMK